MSLWRQLTYGVRNLWNRPGHQREVADEVAHYLDEHIHEGMRRGLSEGEARREARIALGGETQVRELVGAYGWERVAEQFVADVRYAWRGMRARPGFSLTAIVTLALGIGGATAIFGAVYPILYDPLPYPEAERVRVIAETYPDGSRGMATWGMYRGMSDGARTFEAFTVFRPWRPTLLGADQPYQLGGQRVSAEYFRVLGVGPVRGRDFTSTDDSPAVRASSLSARRCGANDWLRIPPSSAVTCSSTTSLTR